MISPLIESSEAGDSAKSEQTTGALIESDYTPYLIGLINQASSLLSQKKLVKQIQDADPGKAKPDALYLACLSHPTRKHFIGAAHGILIHAPIAKVEAAFNDFKSYEDLFDDIDRVDVIDRKTNEKGEPTFFRVHTEQNIPIPLVPNAHITTDYFISRPSPELITYRYQLVSDKKHDDVLKSDGIVILEKRGDTETAYFEIDFLDPNLGGLASLGASKIWPDSVKGFVLSDYALKNFT